MILLFSADKKLCGRQPGTLEDVVTSAFNRMGAPLESLTLRHLSQASLTTNDLAISFSDVVVDVNIFKLAQELANEVHKRQDVSMAHDGILPEIDPLARVFYEGSKDTKGNARFTLHIDDGEKYHEDRDLIEPIVS